MVQSRSSRQGIILKFADDYLQPYRLDERRGQIQPEYCPICGGGAHRDRNSFAINLATGIGGCLRGSCSWHGNFPQLVEAVGARAGDYPMTAFNNPGYRMPEQPAAVQYAMPTSKVYPRTAAINGYLESRKISQATLDAYMVGADESGNILFPFYRGGKLIYVKHRKPVKVEKNKEWQDPGTCPILFGMDLCSPDAPLIITEGMIDCLSLHEAGLRNVTSVPSGCEQLEWIKTCWTFLEKYDQIILFGDNDEPGRKMVDEVVRRLGEARCIVVDGYPARSEKDERVCKDANEILYFCGSEILQEMVRSATRRMPRGLLDLADVDDEDPKDTMRIRTYIPKLDLAIGGLEAGTITVCTGSPGDGKSTLLGQLILGAVEQGHSVCVYSGELPARKFKLWLTLQAAGSDYITLQDDEVKGTKVPFVPRETSKRIAEWFRGHIYLFDNREHFEKSNLNSVMEIFELAAKRYGCDMYVVDNVLTLVADAAEENREQNTFMSQFNAFLIRYNAVGVVVAHARKVPTNQDYLRLNDVSGNSAITKLASSVLVMEKPNIRVLKARDEGRTMLIPMCYCPDSRRIYQRDVADQSHYSWDRSGIPLANPRADSMLEYHVQLSPEPI